MTCSPPESLLLSLPGQHGVEHQSQGFGILQEVLILASDRDGVGVVGERDVVKVVAQALDAVT
jgi:hypothetical protein